MSELTRDLVQEEKALLSKDSDSKYFAVFWIYRVTDYSDIPTLQNSVCGQKMEDLCIEEILKVISNIEIDLNEGWGILQFPNYYNLKILMWSLEQFGEPW